MKNKTHQQKVCEAVLRLMESRKVEKLCIIGVPDEENRREKAVDLRLRGAASEFVLEHTQIESFPQQIADSHRFKKLFESLEADLTGTLPTPGHYKLVVAPGAVEGATDGECIREALRVWVRQKAPTLELGSPSSVPRHYIRETPPGVPFEVTLCRWPGRDGRFLIQYSVPAELEEKRRLRIRRALEDKCPKLKTARGDDRTSVLVLESKDIALGNCADIAMAVVTELSQRQGDIPDEVYLVETETEPWVVWVLKEGLRLFPDVTDAGPHHMDSQAV